MPKKLTCQKCDLYRTCKSVRIGGRGSEKPKVLFIGQAPGSEEDRRGKCFIGPAGKLLQQALEEYDIEDWRLTNTVRCAPLNDRKPLKGEIQACSDYLKEELERCKPKVVVPLGNIALKALTGKLKISAWVGRPLKENGLPFIVFPIFHPSYILHSPGKLREFSGQFQALANFLKQKKKKKRVTYLLMKSKKDFQLFFSGLMTEKKPVAFDFECTTLHPEEEGAEIRCVSFCGEKGTAISVPVNDQTKLFIKDWLRVPTKKIAFNAKFEIQWSTVHFGVVPKNIIGDPMLEHFLLDEESSHKLSTLTYSYTEIGGYDNEMKDYLAEGGTYAECPFNMLWKYNCGDADATLRLHRKFREKLDSKRRKLMDGHLLPLSYLLAEIELRGMYINKERMQTIRAQVSRQMEKLEKKMQAFPIIEKYVKKREKDGRPVKGGTFNFNSSDQLTDLLFKEIKLPVLRETDAGNPSADKDVLEELSGRHPLIPLILQWKELATQISSFIDVLLEKQRKDGTVRTNYLLHVVVTGRLSSRDPNLQNMPREGLVKSGFESRFVGGSFMQADFSQLELRLIGSESEEPGFIEAFKEGKDLHSVTASGIFEKPIKKITDEERNKAKRINFGIVYGISPWGLSKQLKIGEREAKEMLQAYNKLYPNIVRWTKKMHKRAKKNGVVVSWFGRVRHLPGAASGDKGTMWRALRQAGNFPIQSLGADITLWSMNQINRAMKQRGMHSLIIGGVYDSILFDVAPGEEKEMMAIANWIMEIGINKELKWLKIPLKVDISIGENWKALIIK